MTHSWYSISVYLQGEGEIFSGLFKVLNASNLITEFYQTINGNTDLTDNRLIAAGRDTPGSFRGAVTDNKYISPNQYFSSGGVSLNTPNLSVFGYNVVSMTLYYYEFSNMPIIYNSIIFYRPDEFYFYTYSDRTNNYTYTITPYDNPSPNNPCFLEGSKILCFKDNFEVYIPIEQLQKGDLVKTLLNDYVPVEVIGSSIIKYEPKIILHPKDRLFILSKDKYPELFEDLILTGAHSILVDDLTDDQKKRTIEILNELYVTDYKYRLMACLDDKTSDYEYNDDQTIWHIALKNENYYGNYGIYANGLLVESVSIRYMLELSNMVLKD
jgi:hypothetical protein